MPINLSIKSHENIVDEIIERNFKTSFEKIKFDWMPDDIRTKKIISAPT